MMSRSKLKSAFHFGISSLEYSLLGFLIIAVTIFALKYLGQENTTLLNISSNALHTGGTLDLLNPTEPPLTNTSVYKLKASIKLTKRDENLLKSDLPSQILTLGANGATELAAKQLAILAQNLQKEKSITESQYNLLMDMASQGHRIAMIEALIEKAVSQAKENKTNFYESKILFENQYYNPYQLGALIGFTGSVKDQSLPSDLLTGSDPQPEMKKLLSLYAQAAEQGLLNKPEIKGTVENASTRIAQTGEALENTLYEIIADIKPLEASKDLNEEVASSTTHMESGKICKASDYKDNGTTCSP